MKATMLSKFNMMQISTASLSPSLCALGFMPRSDENSLSRFTSIRRRVSKLNFKPSPSLFSLGIFKVKTIINNNIRRYLHQV